MPTVSFSLFGFDSLPAKLWAFSQMGLAKPRLRLIPGMRFFKLMGTGAGTGFSTRPDFGTYSLLAEWESLDEARDRLSSAPVILDYRARAVRSATLYLQPVTSRGGWSGHSFECDQNPADQTSPVVALTRASIRIRKLRSFWARVPAISEAIGNESARRFMIGTGELPWLHQVTVSVWDDLDAMTKFALNSPTHGEAVRRAYQDGWFSEYCFTRFNLLDIDGEWPDLNIDGGNHVPHPAHSSAGHADRATNQVAAE